MTSRVRRVFRWLVRAVLVSSAAFVATVVLFRFVDPPTSAFMLQRRFDAWVANDRRFSLRQHWVPLEHVAPTLALAVVTSEDQKFPTHFGFDVEAIADAVEDRFEGKSTRGASTITQQVVKNLFLWPGQSFVRKALEAPMTLLLELVWPKRRILEVYLNVAEFSDGVYGVDAACRLAFGKAPSKVTPEEAALLAAVLPAPKRRSAKNPDEVTKVRAAWVLEQERALGPKWLEPLEK